MANRGSEDRVGLILDLVDDEFKSKVAENNAAMGELAAAFGRGDLSAEEFDAELKRLGKTQQALAELAREAERAEAQQASARMKNAQAAAQAARDAARAQEQLAAAEAKAEAEARDAWREVAALEQAERDAAAAAKAEMNALYAAEGAMDAFADEAERAAGANGRFGASATGAAGKMGGLNSAIRGLGYGVSDVFANNGPLGQKVQGFANNVGGITTGILATIGKLGPYGMAAAAGLEVLTTAAGAALTAMDIKSVGDFFRLFETKNPFPRTARDVEGMKRELDRAKDAMKGLEEQGQLTAAELAQYNRLRADTARIEKEVADEQERQAALKKGLGAKSEAQRERASNFLEAQDGGGEQLLDRIGKAYAKQGEYDIAAERARAQREIDAFTTSGASTAEIEAFGLRRMAEVERYAKNTRETTAKLAEQLYTQLVEGVEGAEKKLRNLVEGGTGVNFGDLMERLTEKEWEKNVEWQEKFFEELEEANEKLALQADRKRIALLEKTGREGEAAARAQAKEQAPEIFRPEAERRKEEAEKERSAKIEKDAARARVGRQIKDEDASIKAGGYVEMAQALMGQLQAHLRANGGEMVNANGRLVKPNADQQYELVRRQVEAELKARNPRMDPRQRRDLSDVISSRAARGLPDPAAALGETQKAMGATQDNQAALDNRVKALESTAGRLMANARKVGRQITASTPTNLNSGFA